MSLVIICPDRNKDYWIRAFNKTDPSVEVLTEDQVIDNSSVIYTLAWKQPPGIFNRYPNLKCVSSLGAGVDHLVEDPHIPEEIDIVRIIDPVLSGDLFEFALAVIMNRLRSLTGYKIRQVRKEWKKSLYMRIEDLRIGIMGTGKIGNHMATKLSGMGFNVCGWARTKGKEEVYKKYAGQEELDSFLQKINMLICVLPLTKSTKGILNRENLQKLPEGSYLINLARGPHLVDDDLISLLDSGHLSGASLDVFHSEPLPPGHPFWSHPDINLTPHVASITDPERVSDQIIENYHRVKKGEKPLNIVSRKLGY